MNRSITTSSTRFAPRSSWRPSRKLAASAAACSLLLGGASPLASGAGQDEVVDGGTFTLYLQGVRIGEERFVIRSELAGAAGPVYRAMAELNLKLDGRTQRIGVALEVLGDEFRPRRYEAEINGSEATTIVGVLVRDRIRLDVRSPHGDEMKEFLLRGRTAVLERQIAHHHFFVWKLMDGNPSLDATVLVPRDRRQAEVRLEDLGEEPVQIDGRELVLRHIAIVAETGQSKHVWLDGDRVIRLLVPHEEFEAVRLFTADQSPTDQGGLDEL